jgi:hypothetical protein
VIWRSGDRKIAPIARSPDACLGDRPITRSLDRSIARFPMREFTRVPESGRKRALVVNVPP